MAKEQDIATRLWEVSNEEQEERESHRSDTGQIPSRSCIHVLVDDAIAEIERLRDKNRELNKRCQQAESAAANVEKQVRDSEQRGAERQVAASKCVHYADRDAQWERAMRNELMMSDGDWISEDLANDMVTACLERVQRGAQHEEEQS